MGKVKQLNGEDFSAIEITGEEKEFNIISMSPFPGTLRKVKGKEISIKEWADKKDKFYVTEDLSNEMKREKPVFYVACQKTGFTLSEGMTEQGAIKHLEAKMKKITHEKYEESKSRVINYCNIYNNDLAKFLYTIGFAIEDVKHFDTIKKAFKEFKLSK